MRKKAEAAASDEPSSEEPATSRSSQAWAMLIKRVYEVDPLCCPECGGQMKVVSFIEPPQADVIEEILKHCGLWQSRAPRAPPDVDDLVLELDAAYSDSSIDSPGPSRRAPGADLRRHRHVPGELLIIPTRIGTGTMRTELWGRGVFCVYPRACCTPTGLHLASRLQKRPAVRVLKGGDARLSAHAHLELAALAGRLVGNQNSYQLPTA